RRQNKSEDWQRKHYRVQRLIAIGGVLGLVVLSLQWCEMRKSTDAATEAAKAAKDGIELARENIRQDLRAWVLVSAASLNAPIQENHPLVTTLICNNFGKTPAFDVSVSYWTAISAEIDPSKLPRDTASGIESVAIQPPGVPLTGTANFVAVTEEHARMLKAGA